MKFSPSSPKSLPRPQASEQEFLRRVLGNLRTRDPDKLTQAENAIKHRLQQTPRA